MKGKRILAILVMVLLLTGCESSDKAKTKLLDSLKTEKIISKSMELVDEVSYSRWSLEWCTTDRYYIYKDKEYVAVDINIDGTLKCRNNVEEVNIKCDEIFIKK